MITNDMKVLMPLTTIGGLIGSKIVENLYNVTLNDVEELMTFFVHH